MGVCPRSLWVNAAILLTSSWKPVITPNDGETSSSNSLSLQATVGNSSIIRFSVSLLTERIVCLLNDRELTRIVSEVLKPIIGDNHGIADTRAEPAWNGDPAIYRECHAVLQPGRI